jgi:hypothetical protein
MTTPNNTRDVIVDGYVKDDNSRTFRTFQHLRAIASKYGTPDMFLTITPNNSRLQYLYKHVYTGPRVDKE